MSQTVLTAQKTGTDTNFKILVIPGICLFFNDSIQSVVPAMFPILEKSMGLTFTQLGMTSFALNMVSTMMQPFVGAVTDDKPFPFALPVGLTFTFSGF